MNENRLLVADYCDDIRYEIGNKYSMIGCYTSEIIFDTLPSILPKLCASVTAFTPLENPFKKITFRAFLNEELVLENEIPTDQLEANQNIILGKAAPENIRISLKIQLAFIPLVVQSDSLLRIEAETEDGLLRGSRIKLRSRLEGEKV